MNKDYTTKRLNEYCKKFGLCKTGETCQCKKELKFIAETIHQAEQEMLKRLEQELLHQKECIFLGIQKEFIKKVLDNKE